MSGTNERVRRWRLCPPPARLCGAAAAVLVLAAAPGAARALDCTMGEVVWTASESAPSDGIKADGRVLPIRNHPGLFSLIGNKFGGDGRMTFALPDLTDTPPAERGLTPVVCNRGLHPRAP